MRFAAPLIPVLALLLGGCAAPTQSKLSLAPATAASPAARRIELPVAWLPLVDAREAGRHVGQIGLDTYSADDVGRWIETALHALTAQPVLLGDRADPSPGVLCLRPRLHRLYLQHGGVTKSAHIVIALDFHHPGGQAPVTKIYRGRYTAVNWWGTDEEMRLALDRTLRNCLEQIAADLGEQRARSEIQPRAHSEFAP